MFIIFNNKRDIRAHGEISFNYDVMLWEHEQGFLQERKFYQLATRFIAIMIRITSTETTV